LPGPLFFYDYKRKVYRQNKYDLIEIYPRDIREDWERKIDKGIYDSLEGRLRDYVSKS